MKASQKYKNSVFRNIYEQPYNERTRLKLYNSAKGNVDFIQRLALQRSLPVHNGCVNCICWNDTGEYLLSGSDDQYLAISHAYNFKMLTHYKTSHRANIFSAKFLPCSGDKNIVSCSGDGIILFTDLFRASETRNNQFNCHKGTTYEIATVPNEPHTFLSCGEDFTVRSYDLRIKEKCDKENCLEDVLILCQRAVTALSINSVRPYQMAIGCADSTVRIFDRRMIAGTRASGCANMGKGPRPFATFTAPGMEDRSYRITSLGFSPQGEDVLVSYSSEHLYLFSIKDESTMEYEPVICEDQEEDEEEDEGSARVSSGLPPVRRLRLRGDWSDTGPDARPERDAGRNTDAAQARPTLHATLMQRMTDVLSRMLNDPATRAALSHGGEDDHHDFAQDSQNRSGPEDPSGVRNVPEDSPVVAVSIEGVYPEADPVEVASDVASDPNWSPPLASPTTSPAEDTVQLPSFESSFASVAPSSPASALVSTVPPPPLATVSSPVLEPVAEGSSLPSASPMLDAVLASTDENLPSTSTSTSSTSSSKDNLSSLTDQLSTMRHGFIERHGMEPVVNLMYSDKGSTASRISLSVADEVNREAVPQFQEGLAGPSSESELLETPSVPTVVAPEPMSEGEDFAVDSDDEMAEVITQSIRRNISERSPHDIEKEMDEAIKNSRPNATMSDKVKIMKPTVRQKFTGHRNARTMIKEATFWGEDYVLSGSDCGHVFVWDRMTAKLVMLLEADHHVVNCLQPHPFLPLLATSGIDYDVKLWAPILPEPSFNLEMAEELVKRNEVMLEETRDTITVPASFMIRMLACLNQIRRGARSRVRRTDNANGDQSQE